MSDPRQRALLPDSFSPPVAAHRRLPLFTQDWPRLTAGAEPLCAAVAAVIAAYIVWSTVRLVIASALSIPFEDQWDNLILSGHRIFSSWIYAQQNEHRILFPRLIFAIDYWLFHENNHFNFACIVVTLTGICAILIFVLCRDLANLRERLFTAALLAMLFSAMQGENFAGDFRSSGFLSNWEPSGRLPRSGSAERLG
jgi:hypothetical protein